MPAPTTRPRVKVSSLVLRLDDIGTFNVTVRRLNAKINLAKTLKGQAREIGAEIEREEVPPLLAALRRYPGPPRYPIQWKSGRQRRYVMALLRQRAEEEGHPDDIGYKRTGALGRGWKAEVKVETGKHGVVRVRVYNDAVGQPGLGKYARPRQYTEFVQGLAGVGKSPSSVQRYQRSIQPFHTNTGWTPAYTIVVPAYDRMRQRALNSWNARVEQILVKV